MNYRFVFSRIAVLLLLCCSFLPFTSHGQIVVYTNDPAGALSTVATNATGVAVTRVNGASSPGAPCSTGFSAATFSTAASFSSALPALEVAVSPNTGYMLNVTGFAADLRRSASGPAAIRFAYSTDGGTSWTDQGTDQLPNNATCGTTTTGTWATTAIVTAPGQLRLRLYGFNATSTGGTLQALNIKINGTVAVSTGCATPAGLSTSAVTASTATLNWTAASGATSYNIRYRATTTGTWTTATAATNILAVSGLGSSTTYEFQVQTVCAGGPGSYSTSEYFTTLGLASASSGKIAIYFNTPVNNSVSTGVNAIYLNSCMADTLVAYINRAKYTIDIAQYDYNQSSGYTSIATAINNAYAHGVRIRWIYDGAQSNTGLALLNPGIHTLGSPTTSAYGIMHDKFVIIDGRSSNPNDAILSTGSEDWGITQFNSANNNILFIQDSALAHAYLNEFNMMWGDTGIVANATLAKFGPFKTDLGAHIFSIGGKTVELYFSPSDNTDTHIQSAINSANTDLYFGVFTFTMASDANAIVARQTAGVYTRGIVDQNSTLSGAAYPILSSAMGANLKTFSGGSVIYHNKMLVVDPSNKCSDPLVLTGSHNWTASADTKNDENTLIIHNDTIANIYYQAFYGNYTALGGTLTAIPPCTAITCGDAIGLAASSITTTTALLSWAMVSGATGYNIQYRPTGTTTWSSATSATSSATVSGLLPATIYEFQVQTVCASGTSAFSGSATFTTLAVPCSIPVGLSATGITTSSATLSWTAVSGAISYNIQYRQVGAPAWIATTATVNATTVAGLVPGVNYEFEVEVVCISGGSGFSPSANFTTIAITCPIPTGLAAASTGASSVLLSWAAVAGAINYSVQYRVPGTIVWSYTTSAINSVAISGLSPLTTYEYQVQAYCSALDSGGYSPVADFATHSVTCHQPSGLLASGISNISVVLAWGAVSGAAGYTVQYRASGTTAWSYRTTSINSAIITGLSPATMYEYAVQAICSATDSSGYTSPSFFTTNATAVTTAVQQATIAADQISIYPNPTTQDVTISYYLPCGASVGISICDMVGRVVYRVVSNEQQPAGMHTYSAGIAAPGVYFVQFIVGNTTITKKVVRL